MNKPGNTDFPSIQQFVSRHFQEEIEGLEFAEEWIRSHKHRLGDFGSSFEWLNMADGVKGKLFVYWFKGAVAGTATVLQDEHNWTLVNASMFL